jgi:hypothetical protein
MACSSRIECWLGKKPAGDAGKASCCSRSYKESVNVNVNGWAALLESSTRFKSRTKDDAMLF